MSPRKGYYGEHSGVYTGFVFYQRQLVTKCIFVLTGPSSLGITCADTSIRLLFRHIPYTVLVYVAMITFDDVATKLLTLWFVAFLYLR